MKSRGRKLRYLDMGKEQEIEARMGPEELKKGGRKEKTEWEKERRNYFKDKRIEKSKIIEVRRRGKKGWIKFKTDSQTIK